MLTAWESRTKTNSRPTTSTWMRLALGPKILAAATWSAALALVAITSVSLGSWAGDDVMPRVWLRVVFKIFGIRVETTGREQLQPKQHYVYVANHTSMLDGMAVIVSSAHMPRFVGKKAIGRIPILGTAWTKLGHVLIDRSDPASAYRALEEAAAARGSTHSFYFAPEGTRSKSGELGAFKRGAFAFAKSAGLPIVPVAVTGAGELWPPQSMDIRPGVVGVHFGPPFMVDDVDAASQQARHWIAQHLNVVR